MSSAIPRLVKLEAVLENHAEEAQPLEIWMDGDCVLCRRSMAWCELRDAAGVLHFVDFRAQDEKDLPLALERHRESMWVRHRDGILYEGFAAWRRILARIPRWKWLAGLSSAPPVNLIGPPLYMLIAAHRHRPQKD